MREIFVGELSAILGRMYPIPQPCVKCGAPGKHKHHPDYKKPFEIEWLCIPCHHKECPRISKRPPRLQITEKQYEYMKTFFYPRGRKDYRARKIDGLGFAGSVFDPVRRDDVIIKKVYFL